MNALAQNFQSDDTQPNGAAALNGAAQPDVPLRAIANKEQAIMFFEDLEEIITQLLEVLDTETELMRAGNIDQSLALSAKKTALATTYARRTEVLKANATILGRLVPVEVDRLRRRREEMEQTLKTNIAVLAAARAVSEALVKGVAGEMAKKSSGPSVYGGAGVKAAQPRTSAPIAVDRAM